MGHGPSAETTNATVRLPETAVASGIFVTPCRVGQRPKRRVTGRENAAATEIYSRFHCVAAACRETSTAAKAPISTETASPYFKPTGRRITRRPRRIHRRQASTKVPVRRTSQARAAVAYCGKNCSSVTPTNSDKTPAKRVWAPPVSRCVTRGKAAN